MYALIIYTRRGFKSCSSRSSVFFFLSALKKCERHPGMEVVKAHRATTFRVGLQNVKTADIATLTAQRSVYVLQIMDRVIVA